MGYHEGMQRPPQKPPQKQALTNSAFHSTNARSNAQVVENIDVLTNIGVARWNVDKNRITYQKQDSHTLSIDFLELTN